MERNNYNSKNCYFGSKQPFYSRHLYNKYSSRSLGSGFWYDKFTRKSHEDWDIRLNYRSTTSLLEKRFNEYATRWKNETIGYSSTLHITRNDSYLDIIGMGESVVPFILRDLKKEPNHWFVALRAITKENPVQKEHYGNIEEMRQDWLVWGKKNRLI